MAKQKYRFRYRVVAAHGKPPADRKPGVDVVLDKDQGNRVTEFKVNGQAVVWVAVLEFDGKVSKAG